MINGRTMMRNTALLCFAAASAPPLQAQDNVEYSTWQMPKHEVSLSVGSPGLSMPEHHDGNINHSLTFEAFSAVGKLAYFYNFNKHWAVGASANYRHAYDTCDEVVRDEQYGHWIYTGRSNHARFNIVSLMPEARAFWFQRRHFGMYSRFGLGLSFVHMNQRLGGTYRHLYIDPVFELAPIGFDFGGKHFRGKFELGNFGQTFIANVGIAYKF